MFSFPWFLTYCHLVSVPALFPSTISLRPLCYIKNYEVCFIKNHEKILVNFPPSWVAKTKWSRGIQWRKIVLASLSINWKLLHSQWKITHLYWGPTISKTLYLNAREIKVEKKDGLLTSWVIDELLKRIQEIIMWVFSEWMWVLKLHLQRPNRCFIY